ncbi:MAG: DNA repair protein RecN [Acidobacteria bacterium]|nr:DNA repair protein RecN [Acidobacteriota bacterium]
MLKLLNISNLAVVDKLQLEFFPGLNVLSGETGSGKSIIIDALSVLLGKRIATDLIRTGESRAYIEGVFDIAGNTPLLAVLEEAGVELDEEEIVIKRELVTTGRGRTFVNNQTVTTSLLKAIQPHVLDIHGQGDQQSLLASDNHLRLFDGYIGAAEKRAVVEGLYDELLAIVRVFERSRQSESERLQMLDVILYQIGEIEKAAVKVNEDVELETERKLLANAEHLVTLAGESHARLDGENESILAQINAVQRRLGDLAEMDKSFAPYLEQLATAKYTLADLAFYLRDYGDGIDVSPERLRLVEDRLIELDRLKRKYGGTLDSVIETYETLCNKREDLQFSEERSEKLKVEFRQKLKQYESAAKKLSQLRQSKVAEFEKAAAVELSQVALENARFTLRFSPPPTNDWSDWLRQMLELPDLPPVHRNGKELLEFYFTANKGEEQRPLSEVASGGELSRLMLILKTITAPTQFPRTLIFDEIDTGIGGRVADAVGLRLQRLAKVNQILCITHQAQVARYADTHHLVNKEIANERTRTTVAKLNDTGRVEELARMLAGQDITVTARKHAREMLKAK